MKAKGKIKEVTQPPKDLLLELSEIRSAIKEKKIEAQATHHLHINQISEINDLEFEELKLINEIKKEIGL